MTEGQGYNGWKNWDTWETYNWLTSEYDLCKRLEKLAERGHYDSFVADAKYFLWDLNERYEKQYGEPHIDVKVVDFFAIYRAFQGE